MEFDWDQANASKILKRMALESVEFVYINQKCEVFDRVHSTEEDRFKVIGMDRDSRWVHLVITYRGFGSGRVVRPISARFMHAKEVKNYEQS